MAWYSARKGILLFGILGLALSLRLMVAARFVTFDNDTIFYMKFARYFLATGNFTEYTYFGGIIAYVPVFPFFLTLIYFLFEQHVLVVASLANIIFGTLTCLVVYSMGKRILSESAGLLAGLITALTPWLTLWSGFVLMEPLYTLLISLATLLILKQWSLLAGALLGVTILTRTYFLGFLPMLLVATWLEDPSNKRSKRIVSILVGLASVLVLWGGYLFSFQEFRFSEVPHLARTVLGKGVASLTMLGEGFEKYHDSSRAAVSYQELLKRFRGRQVNFWLKAVAKKLGYIWALFPPESKHPLFKIAVAIFYAALFTTALAALGICRDKWRAMVLPLSYLVSFTLLYIPLYAAAFFKDRAPVEPFIVLLSAISLYKICEMLGLGCEGSRRA